MLIPVTAMAIWFLIPVLPHTLPTGQLLLYASALILLQSLARDLWLLSRKSRAQDKNRKAARCMCIESTVGATGVIAGGVLLGAGVGQPVSMSGWSWPVLSVLVLGTGFLVKDYILEWSPWRIRRDKDHMNIVFTWKK